MESPKERILVAVDGSTVSERALRHVGRIVREAPHVHVWLLYLVAPERVGVGKPGALPKASEEVLAALRKEADEVLQESASILAEHGFPRTAIEMEARTTVVGVDVAGDCLIAAEEFGCGTIVVGRTAFGALRELLHRHASDVLVQQSRGIAVWVVG